MLIAVFLGAVAVYGRLVMLFFGAVQGVFRRGGAGSGTLVLQDVRVTPGRTNDVPGLFFGSGINNIFLYRNSEPPF